MQEALPEVRSCFEEWLKLEPALAGKIAVKFRIVTDENDPSSGVVDKVELAEEQRLGHVAMEGCVLNVFQELRFEAPKDGKLDVTYPMQFTSGELDASQPN